VERGEPISRVFKSVMHSAGRRHECDPRL